MSSNKKYVLIIDSFRSHNALAFKCHAQNIIPIHIFSSKKSFEDNFFAVANILFIKSFIFENMEMLMEELMAFKHNISFVFSCTEQGQHIKDALDMELNCVAANPSNFTSQRYNKFVLYQTLEQECASENFDKFVERHNECVIKPADVNYSGGCLDVTFVNGQTRPINDDPKLFISAYFQGDEYAVDFVSCDGKHKLVSVWKYIRSHNDKIFKDKVVLMHYEENSDLINKIYEVAASWLNKIQHKFGPVHIEIKHVDITFRCIEINFRLHGHMHYGSLVKWLQYNQVDLTIDCYTAKSKFSHDLVKYYATGYISRIYLSNTQNNKKYTEVDWKSIESAPSVDLVYKHCWPWENLPVSQKTSQSSVLVIMSDKNYHTLCQNELAVKEIFYNV
jgi:hypothetical protein